MSRIDNVVDGVLAVLNGAPAGTFGLAFTAESADLPLHDLAELATLKVLVVPSGTDSEIETRSTSRHEITVDVAVQKHLAQADAAGEKAEIRTLRNLVEAIGDFLERGRLGNPAFAAWLKTQNQPIYSPDHLREMRVFTSVLHVTYRTN
jgi:hypothetical protein